MKKKYLSEMLFINEEFKQVVLVQIDTACARLDCYCIHNKMQYNLYLPPLSPAMSVQFMLFFGKPVMHTRWADGYCFHHGCSASCMISTKSSAYCIYQMKCRLYLPDIQHKLCLPLSMCGRRSG